MQIHDLLTISIKANASDLHIAPNMPPMLRMHGDIIPIQNYEPLSAQNTKELIYNLMTTSQQTQFETNLELDFSYAIPHLANFRINAFHQHHGIAAVIRIIPLQIPTLEQLYLPPIFKTLLDLPNGLILITGPAGSGKSTTLSAMINYLNMHKASHIITIEDPIEFIHVSKKSLINQRQIQRDTHDFNSALRAALRENPDVILLGELRDLETIRLALTAAETGHLVLATLHTSSAPRTVSRIVNVFSGDEKPLVRNLLAESLQAVICQTLLKMTTARRIAALEIMISTPAIRHLIREDKIAQMLTTIQTGSEFGMVTLDQSLQNLLRSNQISLDIAIRAAQNKELFK